MMLKEFENLSTEEQEIIVGAVAQITVLIAGADGTIDDTETQWAQKLTKIRSYSYHDDLNGYYKLVGKDFSEKVSSIVANLPKDKTAALEQISGELSKLNAIFPKVPTKFAISIYDSLRSFAEHVAKSSGGFMNFFSVNTEESILMELPMVKKPS